MAAAVVEFVTGDLVGAPRRAGKPLQRELEGRWGGTPRAYRILYAVDEDARAVTVLAVEHRRDICRVR